MTLNGVIALILHYFNIVRCPCNGPVREVSS